MYRNSPRKREDDQRLAERAAEWLHVLKQPTPEERAEFAEWLSASPRHAEEFLLITALSEQLKSIDVEHLPDLQAALAKSSGNIVPLPNVPETNVPASRPAVTRHRKWQWPAGLAAAAAGAAIVWWQMAPDPNTYVTATGEQRTIQLEDGSTMDLNARSRVQIRFTKHARDIRLLDGEALFTVHQDTARPFRVSTQTAVVQAIGTSFNVYHRASNTTVSVVDGRVKIDALREGRAFPPNNPNTSASSGSGVHAPSPSSTQLAAGEEAKIAANGDIVKHSGTDAVARSIAWRRHRLVFLSDTLASVAAEFNRYNHTPKIVVDDETVAARRYSGVFDSGDPQSLIQFLREDSELHLEQSGDKLIIRAK